VSTNGAIAYREDGTLKRNPNRARFKKLPKQASSLVSVDGAFMWTWLVEPPEPVAACLRSLCPDVSHLGTTESPVRLRVDETATQGTHRQVVAAGAFPEGPGEEVDVAASGRLDELLAAHRDHRSGKLGTERVGSDERSVSPVPPRAATRSQWYAAVSYEPADVPWPEVLLVPLSLDQAFGRVRERDRVAWAVAAHRALIKVLDRDAPPLLTGAYPVPEDRPANRVALHLLTRDQPVDLPNGSGAALAVLLPRSAEAAQLQAVYRGIEQLRGFRSRNGQATVMGRAEARAGDLLWREPSVGVRRLWRTSPAAVPDTRGHQHWTFTHAALLSLGFVWQGSARLPPLARRGAARDRAIVDAVNAVGVGVLRATPLRTPAVADYVHRVHPDAVVRPYRALLHMGDLSGARTVQAIGQARHLGGGLLVPEDYPEGSVLGDGR